MLFLTLHFLNNNLIDVDVQVHVCAWSNIHLGYIFSVCDRSKSSSFSKLILSDFSLSNSWQGQNQQNFLYSFNVQ